MHPNRSAADALVPGARCATHAERAATGVCARCGDYVCGACSERVGERLYCPGCGPRVGSEHSPRAVQALVLGLLSAHLLVFLAPPAIALSLLELNDIKQGRAPAGGRGLSLAALGLAVASFAMSVVGVLMWLNMRSEP